MGDEKIQKRPVITRERVKLAALRQFKEEFNVTQKGILNRIGYGSEKTINDFLKEIRLEETGRDMPVFSPEMPEEFIQASEAMWQLALKNAEGTFKDEREKSRGIENDALSKVIGLEQDLVEANDQRQKLELQVLEYANKAQASDDRCTDLKESLEESKQDAIALQLKNESQAKEHSESMNALRESHRVQQRELEQSTSEKISQLTGDLREASAKLEAAEEKVVFERERSEQETGRLMTELDGQKRLRESDKETFDKAQTRLEAELEGSHKREAKLEKRIESLTQELAEAKKKPKTKAKDGKE